MHIFFSELLNSLHHALHFVATPIQLWLPFWKLDLKFLLCQKKHSPLVD